MNFQSGGASLGDSLLITSTLPGFVSRRDEDTGSSYIQILCKYVDSVTPGLQIKDVSDAHCEATQELRGMRFQNGLSPPDGDGINDRYISHQTPSLFGYQSWRIGFLPSSDGKEKIRCFFKLDDYADCKYLDKPPDSRVGNPSYLVDYLEYVKSTGGVVEYPPPEFIQPMNHLDVFYPACLL